MLKRSLRNRLHNYIPAQFEDPFGLALRIMRSRSRAAYWAAGFAALQFACTPVDWGLRKKEEYLYRTAKAPKLPIIFIAGPPRSGTTVVAQALISSLSVSYFNNLTSVFPNSPIVVNKLIKNPFRNESLQLVSFYGKSKSWYGPNDALYLWDRWFGPHRKNPPTELNHDKREQLIRFFGAFEAAFGKPLIAKNNSLNAYAHLVLPHLSSAHVICMRRDPLYLAQSLLNARKQIHGTHDTPYGIDDPSRPRASGIDPIRDVCRQVRYYQNLERKQIERLGPDRFTVVDYESFCQNPNALVERVADLISAGNHAPGRSGAPLKPLTESRRQTLPRTEFEALKGFLADSGLA